MTSPAVNPPRCDRCSSILVPGASCGSCGFVPGTPALPPRPMTAAPRSAGLAVVLTFLLLGGGHLYLGKVGAGVALIVWDIFLIFLLFIPIVGFLASLFLWFVTFVIAAILVTSEAGAQNRAVYGR